MTTPLPQSKGNLTREEIEKYLIDQELLSPDGRQIGYMPREVVESLIEMNGGPQGLDLSHRDFSGQNLSGIDLTDTNLLGADFTNTRLYYDQLNEDQRAVIRGEPSYLDDPAQQSAVQQASAGASVFPDLESVGLKSAGADIGDLQPPPTFLRGRTFATNDVFDGVDRLDMSKYARALARLVMMEESVPPITIGIYGEWGSGKSALLNLIRQELEREQASRNLPLLIVDFNAWEHAGDHNKLWTALTQAIVAAMDERTSRRKRFIYGINNNLRFLWERAKQRWPVSIVGATGLAAMICGQAWGWSSGTPSNMAWAVTGLGALFGSPSFFESFKNGLLPALNKPASSRLSMLIKDATDINESQSVAELISHMLKSLEVDIPSEFEDKDRPLGSWPGANPTDNKGLKTVVFIDDLDRCPPDKIVDVLEGIKLILKDRSFVVFIAADTRIVSRAIEFRYRQILHSGRRRPAGELGMEYLAKIVQIPFLLPKPGKVELQNLVVGRQPLVTLSEIAQNDQNNISSIDPVTITNGDSTVEGIEGDTESASSREGAINGDLLTNGDDNWETLTIGADETQTLVDLAHQFTQNPRTYNRLGNELRLMRLLLHEEGLADDWEDERGHQLIKWLILCDQWPAFGQYLCIDQAMAPAEDFENADIMLEIAKSPEALRHLRTRYDQTAIDDLHAFLEQAPPLSMEIVKQLVPFTTNLNGIYE